MTTAIDIMGIWIAMNATVVFALLTRGDCSPKPEPARRPHLFG
jgi:hypothetical protein